MKAYQAAQQKYKTDIKKKVTRQVQIVKPDATEEEIDEIMRCEGGRDSLYRERILAGGVNDQVKTSYAKVAGKYQDVLALEQSVAELHQMFLDFALLTEQQGELLDKLNSKLNRLVTTSRMLMWMSMNQLSINARFERNNAGLSSLLSLPQLSFSLHLGFYPENWLEYSFVAKRRPASYFDHAVPKQCCIVLSDRSTLSLYGHKTTIRSY